MSSSNPITSSTNLFRRLTWQSQITLSIRLSEHSGSTGLLERYYMQVPRYTYLPLLIPEIRENFVDLVLTEKEEEGTTQGVDEKEWWFEEEDSGTFTSQGPCKWHWPLDLIDLHSTISNPYPSPSSSSSQQTTPTTPNPPLRLILHLKNPPADKLLLSNTVEACKNQYINTLKEADFVRWRNTNKVTSLRKVDLDGGWDGIVQDDYDLYMRMATRLLPLPIPITSPSSTLPSRPASTDPTAGSSTSNRPDSSYSVKALPIKIYLPDGAPVIQEVITPLTSSGKPQKLIGVLREYLPLLFPPPSSSPTSQTTSSAANTTSSSSPSASPLYPLAIPIAQGVELPPEAELAWLSSCMCGVDGWLRIGIQLKGE